MVDEWQSFAAEFRRQEAIAASSTSVTVCLLFPVRNKWVVSGVNSQWVGCVLVSGVRVGQWGACWSVGCVLVSGVRVGQWGACWSVR